jgi:hypothetical protein
MKTYRQFVFDARDARKQTKVFCKKIGGIMSISKNQMVAAKKRLGLTENDELRASGVNQIDVWNDDGTFYMIID